MSFFRTLVKIVYNEQEFFISKKVARKYNIKQNHKCHSYEELQMLLDEYRNA